MIAFFKLCVCIILYEVIPVFAQHIEIINKKLTNPGRGVILHVRIYNYAALLKKKTLLETISGKHKINHCRE